MYPCLEKASILENVILSGSEESEKDVRSTLLAAHLHVRLGPELPGHDDFVVIFVK
jgi:hypothetical protein